MSDQALLIISIMTEKWFRKILFIFNLTGVFWGFFTRWSHLDFIYLATFNLVPAIGI